jgi:hypothetical protein
VPLVGCDPLQLPEALHDVAFVDDHVSIAPCPAGTIELLNDSVTVEPPPEDDDEEPPELDEELELLLEEDSELLPEEGLPLLPPPPPHAASARSVHTTAQTRAMAVRWFVTLSPGEPTAAGAADKCRSCLTVLHFY